ncbi:unnamed protein product [Gordionus sp. m RMFG-2023]
MEFKYETITVQTLNDKFNENRGADSGISDHASICSSYFSAMDYFEDEKKEMARIENTVGSSSPNPTNSRFTIHRVVEKFMDQTPAVKICLSLPIRFEIRNPHPSEIREICKWSYEEFGYRPHRDYLMSLYNCYPSGWVVAVNKKGKIIGTIFGINMNDDQAFGGVFAVKKRYRCKGVGGQLWQIRLNHIGNRNLGVNAVESRIVPNEKLGMKLAFRMSKYYGRITGKILNSFRAKLSLQANSNYMFTKMSNEENELQNWLLHSLIKYDTQINTISRPGFLEDSIYFEHAETIVCTENITTTQKYDKNQNIEMPHKVVGYGMLRPHFDGSTIGPIYADSPIIAEFIFIHLLNQVTEPNTLVDITIIDECFSKRYAPKTMKSGPQNKSVLGRCLKNMITNLGLDFDCHMFRMYTKNVIQPVNKVFAMTSSEPFLF